MIDSVYTALFAELLPLWMTAVVFLTVGIHARSREALHRHLLDTKTKRAIKEAQRTHTNLIWGVHTHLLRGFCDHMTLKWRRTLAGDGDQYARRICAVNNAALLILPIAVLLCIAGYRLPVLVWLMLPLVMTESAVWLWLVIICIRSTVQKPVRRKRSPYEKKSLPAYFLRYGYIIPGMVTLSMEKLLLTGLLWAANAVHMLIARACKADHFYCMMQNVGHRPMTPHHHNEAFRRRAEKEGLQIAVVDLIAALLCIALEFLLPVFFPE